MKCNYCDKEIKSKFLKDFWGNCYHLEHKGFVQGCSYCGRVISKKLTEGGKRYRDGKYICGLCSKEAVNEQSQIQSEYRYILDIMVRIGFDLKKYKTDIYLINRDESSKVTREEPGYIKCEMIKSNGFVTSISFKIYILKGLPREYFIETLSHEMMHQWLTLNGKEGMKPVLLEGACNYIAYYIMERLKTPLCYYIIDNLLKDPHPHYGKGFRKVLEYARKNGHISLIKLLKNKIRI